MKIPVWKNWAQKCANPFLQSEQNLQKKWSVCFPFYNCCDHNEMDKTIFVETQYLDVY